MTHPELQELARILVTQCVETQPGEYIWIRALSLEAVPLAREVYREVVRQNALPLYDIHDDQVAPFFYRHATLTQLNAKPELMEYLANKADKTITIVGEANKRELSGVDPKKLLERSKLVRPVKDVIMKKPWVLTYVPTPGMAQDANMSLEDFESFYFNAVNRDWNDIQSRMQRFAEFFTDAKDIHVVGEKTDLHLSVVGKTWVSDDWKANMPGGEVFTSPVKTSVEGTIYFNYPLTYQGKMMRDITLTFEQGQVVAATASEGQAFLEELLNTDSDARYLGEFALGGNPGITQYMNSVLFDEKMEGTLHCALGQGFPECGGETQSAIHMDIVKNMRIPGSTITVDGTPFLKDGKIVL